MYKISAPPVMTQAAVPVRVDELVRDNDAAIEARVQVLASAIAAESGAPQPDFALVDCLHQQIADLRTIQGNFRQFVWGASSLGQAFSQAYAAALPALSTDCDAACHRPLAG